MPARGAGKRISVSAVDRFIATATRSTPSPCGAAKTATRTAPSGSFQPACVIGPSASRHSTSGRPLASNGAPVRKASRDSAELARRASMSRAVKAISEASAARQSIALVALSWA